MPEATSNVEYAHRIHEDGHHHPSSDKQSEWVALAEAVVLAIVAVATAWSGYQAAKWDARSAKEYALSSVNTVLSQEKATIAGQDRLYDITTFNGWMFAKTLGNKEAQEFYERRFRPEYAVAFQAWMKLDPFNNPSAPPGPIYMQDYKDSNALKSADLNQEAQRHFQEAVSSRETGDQYVKVTVFLATVLLLTALSQRFKPLGPRAAVVAIAFVLLIVSSYLLITLPRL